MWVVYHSKFLDVIVILKLVLCFAMVKFGLHISFSSDWKKEGLN